MTVSIKEISSGGMRFFTVGVVDQVGWTPLHDCDTRNEAMAWMSYLNGGQHPYEIAGYWSDSPPKEVK